MSSAENVQNYIVASIGLSNGVQCLRDLRIISLFIRPVAQLKQEPVENTRLVFHLQKMLKLLVEEQAETPTTSPTWFGFDILLFLDQKEILVNQKQTGLTLK